MAYIPYELSCKDPFMSSQEDRPIFITPSCGFGEGIVQGLESNFRRRYKSRLHSCCKVVASK